MQLLSGLIGKSRLSDTVRVETKISSQETVAETTVRKYGGGQQEY
jgi:hypothetical protein